MDGLGIYCQVEFDNCIIYSYLKLNSNKNQTFDSSSVLAVQMFTIAPYSWLMAKVLVIADSEYHCRKFCWWYFIMCHSSSDLTTSLLYMSICSCIHPHFVSKSDCCVFIENVLLFGEICLLHSSGFLLPLCIYHNPGVVVSAYYCLCTHAQPYWENLLLSLWIFVNFSFALLYSLLIVWRS